MFTRTLGLCFAVDGFASDGGALADACLVGEFDFGRNAAGRSGGLIVVAPQYSYGTGRR